MAELNVFVLGPDMVVAKDQEDAWSVLLEHHGAGSTKDDFGGADEEWEELPGDRALTIWNEDVDSRTCECQMWPARSRFPNGHHRMCYKGFDRLTCAEWTRRNGRGFLCSEEY